MAQPITTQLLLIILIILLSGCGSRGYVELGIGHNSGNWENHGELATTFGFGVVGPITESLDYDCGYFHDSQLGAGWPVNDVKGESFLNLVFCKGRYWFDN